MTGYCKKCGKPLAQLSLEDLMKCNNCGQIYQMTLKGRKKGLLHSVYPPKDPMEKEKAI